MNKLILIVLVCLSSLSFAQTEAPVEAGWKGTLRPYIVKYISADWAVKLLGEAPKPVETIALPEIPKTVQNNTDLKSFDRIKKEETEYDRLPPDKKRQYDYNFINEIYMVTRKTPPRDEDFSKWLNSLEQGGSREGLYQALVLDEMYTSLESIEEKSNDSLIKFSLDYSQKFLNQTFAADAVKDLNVYSLKRILTEKTLDILGHYETHNLDDIYRWYAVFSAFIGKEYGTNFTNPVRANPDVEFHYKWAKEMPIQHIKSEAIIKLHTVMNRLQTLQ